MSISPEFYSLLKRTICHNLSAQPKRPCHFNELFITHKGDVYPCCRVWTSDYLKIGHINDSNLSEKIESFNRYCACEVFELRKGLQKDEKKYNLLNIELSLACQAQCAMCCVGAPSWHGVFDYYDSLMKIVDFCKPIELLVQGGEVLIQKKSLNWIAEIRKKYPDIKFSLVTNGNANLEMIDLVEELFDIVIISIVGFEPETYKKIMGLEFQKTIQFAEELIKRKKILVFLKYLITPINVHETNLFLDWAIKINPDKIIFSGSNMKQYINMNTFDDYWNKIFRRTSQDLKTIFIKNKLYLLEKKVKIGFDLETGNLFNKIDKNFIKENDLNDVIFTMYKYK